MFDSEYFCPNCGAILNEQIGFDPSCGVWECTACGQTLMDDDVYEGDTFDGVVWYCDECGALLNRQDDFSDIYGSWICTECGHINGTTEDDIAEEKSFAAEIGGIIGECIASAVIAAKDRERKERKAQQEELHALEQVRQMELAVKRQKRHNTWKRHKKIIIIGIVAAVLLATMAIALYETSKLIPIGYNSEELIGKNYETVSDKLAKAGFTNIRVESVEDLDILELEKENTVHQVLILGKGAFRKEARYPYDIPIIVKYHQVKKVCSPLSAKEAKGTDYEDVVYKFEQAGFINVRSEIIYDIITGWLNDVGAVEYVTIDGNRKFDTATKYRPDVEVVITYHDLKKNKK